MTFFWPDDDEDVLHWDDDDDYLNKDDLLICQCPYCTCAGESLAGGPCDDCLSGAHQG